MNPGTRQLLDAVAAWMSAGAAAGGPVNGPAGGPPGGPPTSVAARGPLVVAIDGHGAAGKSTLAADVAARAGAALLHTDDFYRDPPPGCDVHDIGAYYDWAGLRAAALIPLLGGRAAGFRRGRWVTPGPAGRAVRVEPAPVILLEGVSACAPALADLVDRRVLVDTPEPERRRRLEAIWSDAEWDHDWLAAEAAHLAGQPRTGFDLIVAGDAAEGNPPHHRSGRDD